MEFRARAVSLLSPEEGPSPPSTQSGRSSIEPGCFYASRKRPLRDLTFSRNIRVAFRPLFYSPRKQRKRAAGDTLPSPVDFDGEDTADCEQENVDPLRRSWDSSESLPLRCGPRALEMGRWSRISVVDSEDEEDEDDDEENFARISRMFSSPTIGDREGDGSPAVDAAGDEEEEELSFISQSVSSSPLPFFGRRGAFFDSDSPVDPLAPAFLEEECAPTRNSASSSTLLLERETEVEEQEQKHGLLPSVRALGTSLGASSSAGAHQPRSRRSSPFDFDMCISAPPKAGYWEEMDGQFRMYIDQGLFFCFDLSAGERAKEVLGRRLRREYQNRLMLDVFGDGPLLGGISVRHHGVVVGWLCEVADFLCCNPESLHLAVNLLDRCLVEMPTIRLSSLQLLAVSCMWIATKYEEVDFVDVSQMADLTAGGFSCTQVRTMETVVLNTLGFSLATVSPFSLLKLFLCECPLRVEFHAVRTSLDRVAECKEKRQNMLESLEQESLLAEYLLELSLYDSSNAEFSPGVLACSALFLSRATLHIPTPWVHELYDSFGCSVNELRLCVRRLHAMHAATSDNPQGVAGATYVRYSKKGNARVSRVCPLPSVEEAFQFL